MERLRSQAVTLSTGTANTTARLAREKVRCVRVDLRSACCRCSGSPGRCCQSAGKWSRRVPLTSEGFSCRNRLISAFFLSTGFCGESVASAEASPPHTHHPPTSSAARRAGCFPLGPWIQRSVMRRSCGDLSPDFFMCSLAHRSAPADGVSLCVWRWEMGCLESKESALRLHLASHTVRL